MISYSDVQRLPERPVRLDWSDLNMSDDDSSERVKQFLAQLQDFMGDSAREQTRENRETVAALQSLTNEVIAQKGINEETAKELRAFTTAVDKRLAAHEASVDRRFALLEKDIDHLREKNQDLKQDLKEDLREVATGRHDLSKIQSKSSNPPTKITIFDEKAVKLLIYVGIALAGGAGVTGLHFLLSLFK